MSPFWPHQSFGHREARGIELQFWNSFQFDLAIAAFNATLLLILLNKKNKEICLSCNLIPWNIDWEINEFS